MSPVRWREVDDLLRGEQPEQLGCLAQFALLALFGILMAVGLWLIR